MRGAIHPLPQYTFMAWCSVSKKHRDKFTLTLPLPYCNELELGIKDVSDFLLIFMTCMGHKNEESYKV
jgi:hypothetical protein